MSAGSFSSGLYFGVTVVLFQGTSVTNLNDRPFSASAIRTFLA